MSTAVQLRFNLHGGAIFGMTEDAVLGQSPIWPNKLEMAGTVVRGHRIASGLAANCPWPGGSIARQLRRMGRTGLDVGSIFPGTLNVALTTETVDYPEEADFDFVLDWRHPDKPTHIRLHAVVLQVKEREYDGWAYRKLYPAEYVSLHPQPDNVIEVLAPFIPGIAYGCPVTLRFRVTRNG